MDDNLLLQHILFKSKYLNLKEFSKACYEFLSNNPRYNWSNTQSLYVRLRDNLIGDSQTIFCKKQLDIRKQRLIQAISYLLGLHPSEVIRLATTKRDKTKQINDLQDQIDDAKRRLQECSINDQTQQIQILSEIIQHLNQLIYLK